MGEVCENNISVILKTMEYSQGWDGCLFDIFYLIRINQCGTNNCGTNVCGINVCEFSLNSQTFVPQSCASEGQFANICPAI